MVQGLFDTNAVADRTAPFRLHQTLPAVEDIPTAFRLALGSRDQACRLPADGAPGWLARSLLPANIRAAASLSWPRNIQHTARYTELSPDRFKDFWR
jgi:hypothetical protein